MLFTKREEGREGGREGEREISLEKSDNGIIRQNTDMEIQVAQVGPISYVSNFNNNASQEG